LPTHCYQDNPQPVSQPVLTNYQVGSPGIAFILPHVDNICDAIGYHVLSADLEIIQLDEITPSNRYNYSQRDNTTFTIYLHYHLHLFLQQLSLSAF
jgi:hypothetical protein